MASIIKRCDCGDWDDCPHPWVVRYRTPAGGRAGSASSPSATTCARPRTSCSRSSTTRRRTSSSTRRPGQVTVPRRGRGMARAPPRRGQQHRHLPVGAPHPRVPGDRGPADPGDPPGGHQGDHRRDEPQGPVREPDRLRAPGRQRGVQRGGPQQEARRVALHRHPAARTSSTRRTSSSRSTSELEALAAGLPADWAATVWLMYGCGLRIGEALAVRTRCRINQGTTLRVREQVNPAAQLRPLKFRVEGQFRDIPLPLYCREAIDKHIAGPRHHRRTGTCSRDAGTST